MTGTERTTPYEVEVGYISDTVIDSNIMFSVELIPQTAGIHCKYFSIVEPPIKYIPIIYSEYSGVGVHGGGGGSEGLSPPLFLVEPPYFSPPKFF